MSETPLFKLNFEPSGNNFFDEPDGSLYAVHAGSAVGINDGQHISFQDIGHSTISVNLKTAQHGKYASKPASLLLFEFTFFSPRRQNRIKYASIDIEFKYGTTPRPPHIQCFCPRHVVGDVVKRKITTEANVGVSVGISNSPLGVNIHRVQNEEHERLSQFTLISKITKTYSNGREVNGIRWVLTENENSKSGIPYFLPIALLVRRKEAHNFTAKINIAAKISPTLSPKSWFGVSACIPKPIVIDVKTMTGKPIVDNADMLEDVDLKTLVSLPDNV